MSSGGSQGLHSVFQVQGQANPKKEAPALPGTAPSAPPAA